MLEEEDEGIRLRKSELELLASKPTLEEKLAIAISNRLSIFLVE